MPDLTNLKNLLKERGMAEGLSKSTGISSGNISDWKSGRSKPGLESLLKIADYFDCSVDYLLDRTDVREVNSNMQQTIIYKFPVYEQQAAAGAGITGRDGKFTMENIFTDVIPQNAVFGVHIRGESMINTDPKLNIDDIPDNSFVLLNPKVSVSDLNKTIVVASINNEVICKYFLIEQDGVHFYSLNREEHVDDDRFVKSPNEYRVIGQVVKIIKPDEHE